MEDWIKDISNNDYSVRLKGLKFLKKQPKQNIWTEQLYDYSKLYLDKHYGILHSKSDTQLYDSLFYFNKWYASAAGYTLEIHDILEFILEFLSFDGFRFYFYTSHFDNIFILSCLIQNGEFSMQLADTQHDILAWGFYIYGLKSFKNFPKIIYDDYDIGGLTKIETLENGPELVTGNFNLSYMRLKTLKNFPKCMGDVIMNHVTSETFEGFPSIINGDLYIYNTRIENYTGAKLVEKIKEKCIINGDIIWEKFISFEL